MTQIRITIIIRTGIINLILNDRHRLENNFNLLETRIKRSNIQNNVIQDEITRKEEENS
jgi:hypothetical protein